MRTLKNISLHFRDFWLILLIKVPLNLFITKRGRLILALLFGAFVVFWGFHFWNLHEIYYVHAPDEIEKIFQENHLNHPMSLSENRIDYYGVKIYPSTEEFIEKLEPGEPISVSYYFETTEQLGEKKGLTYFVKVYQAREDGREIIYRVPCNYPSGSMIINYGLDYLSFEMINAYKAVLIWILGGSLCFFGTMINLIFWDEF